MRLLPALIVTETLLFLSCSPKSLSLSRLRSTFERPEYVSQGDGWAEARRRRLISRYLHQNGFVLSASQEPYTKGVTTTKYRRVNLVARRPARSTGERVTLTLALFSADGTGQAEISLRQRECDRVLFHRLENLANVSLLRLEMTESCLDLTPGSEPQD